MVCGGVESIQTQLTELRVCRSAPSTCHHINQQPPASCAMANSRSTSAASTPPTTVFTVPAGVANPEP